MCSKAKLTSVFAAYVGSILSLQGCGGGGNPSPAPPSPSIPNAHCKSTDSSGLCQQCEDGYIATGPQNLCLYACTTNLKLGPIKAAKKKGLMMDDTTHRWCPDSMHSVWANTNEPIQSVRISKAWEADWPSEQKQAAWDSITAFLHTTGAKALVGTSLSCNETNDANDWEDVKKLLQQIGPDSIMGVAIGNELDLMWQHASASCLKNLWQDGYISRTFDAHANDLDKLGTEWKSIKLTSPFSEYIFAQEPFVDQANSMVKTFITTALRTWGDRFVFSINDYPYFDTGNTLDGGKKDRCEGAIQSSTCFNSPSCRFMNAVATLRNRMKEVNATANLLWITETGWSSPKADDLKWDPADNPPYQMANCTEFSSLSTMRKFYSNFLAWDLSISPLVEGPDHVFFFSMRDSSNFGDVEHFGLGGSGDLTKLCVNATCKLQNSGETSLVV